MTNSNMRSTALALLILTIDISVRSQSQTGRLKGVIVDWQHARVLPSCLDITNKDFAKRVSANENGAFEVELPAGKYRITAQAPHFKRFTRNHV